MVNDRIYKLNREQYDAVLALPAEKRYQHFLSRVADWEILWTLHSETGFVLFGDDSGHECVPFWPHPGYAVTTAQGQWSDCSPYEVSLSDFMGKWLPGMLRDGRKVAVFPTPQKKAVVVEPNRLQEDLEVTLEQYE